MPFAALVLCACLLMTRLSRRISLQGVREEGMNAFIGRTVRDIEGRSRVRVSLGIVLAIAALTRNEAIWLAATFAIIEWSNVRQAFSRFSDRIGAWGINVIPVALVAFISFSPWALRDWLAFGSPFPGQALANAFSLDGRDIFAWQDPPTLSRYLAAGVATLLELRWTGFLHNVLNVLLLLGVPLSVVGLIGLPGAWRGGDLGRRHRSPPAAAHLLARDLRGRDAGLPRLDHLGHVPPRRRRDPRAARRVGAAGARCGHRLGRQAARLDAPGRVARAGVRRSPAACCSASCCCCPMAMPRARPAARYAALAAALEDGSAGVVLSEEPGPVITDFPIWLAEATRHETLGLPNESPASIHRLASTFDPPARLLVVDARNDGVWPAAILSGAPGSECFLPLSLPDSPDHPGALDDFLVFRIRCP